MTGYVTYERLGKNGRLGNQLWQIAWIMGEANITGRTPLVDPNWEYRPYFSLPEEMYGTPPVGADILDGGTEYFQELRHFQAVEDRVREAFRFRNITDPDGGWARVDARAGDTLCSVHVRRGDYLNHPNVFTQLGVDWYVSAMKHVLGQRTNVTFVVFSDDPQWCKENLHSAPDGNSTFIIDGVPREVEPEDRKGEPQDQRDMAFMLGCDFHVISNSTFAWWGAWLSESQQIIYPDSWFGPDARSPRGGPIPWRRMIPHDPKWVALPV